MHRFSDASYRVIKLMNPRETALRKVLDGQGAKTDVPAYELETSVIIWNKPGVNAAFPSFVTAISCHNPGELTGHAAELMRRQKTSASIVLNSMTKGRVGTASRKAQCKRTTRRLLIPTAPYPRNPKTVRPAKMRAVLSFSDFEPVRRTVIKLSPQMKKD